ncbi:glycosyltransferase family A protein [Reichenbachiella ulvae]|uniref:Glycosyltransferase family 2 protein n=1 Tax=Reichenbachiella ulvae TaxID=2980104 RepID=A0ABT3CUN8_9BACT|nr:glycosyltransferase family A protein [Reichenbachiella ulvae]MCV9387234.1 glycosyltransferase family 2 protein [Reichenbachiella ulvae]
MVVYFLTASIVLLIFIGIHSYNYLSGKRLIKNILYQNCLKKKDISVLDKEHNDISITSDIIISLTTIPERINDIELTIKSLLNQSVKPKSINLYIPYRSLRNNKEYVIPEWLHKLKNVKVIRIEKDYGSASKFIPAIESCSSEQYILVVDDDNIYPSNYVRDFSEASSSNPEVVLAASGWRVPKDLIDRSTTLYSNIFKVPPTPVPGTRIKEVYPIDIVQGYSGFLIKPAFFNLEILKDYSNVPEAVFFVDDVWVSAHCKVPKYVFPISRFCFVPFGLQDYFKQSSLAKINNWDRVKDEDRNNSIAIKFLKDKWAH